MRLFTLCKVVYRCARDTRTLPISRLAAAQQQGVRCAAVNRMKIERTLIVPALTDIAHEEKC